MVAPVLAPNQFSSSASAAELKLFDNDQFSFFRQFTTWTPGNATAFDYRNSATFNSGGNISPRQGETNNQISSQTQQTDLTTAGDSGVIGQGQTGFLWDTREYSYANDFSVSANIYMGARDGADGLSFMMKPASGWPNASGTYAAGTRFARNVNGQIRVDIDTYKNGNESANDFVEIYSKTLTGGETKYSPLNGDGTTGAPISFPNANGTSCVLDTELEDNLYTYYFTFQWVATTRTLNVFGGAEANCLILSANVTTAHQDATSFVWGFQAETGGANNYQSVGDVKFQSRTIVSPIETDTALSLNGTDNIAVGPSAGVGSIYDFGSTWTAEAWINPNSECVGDLFCNIITKEFVFLLATKGNRVYFSTGNGSAWNIVWRNAGGVVPTGSWSHIAVTFAGNVLTVYLNGTSIYTENSVANLGANSDYFAVGGRTSLTYAANFIGEEFYGKIDEVRIWNSARSQSNISSGMHARPSLSDSNLKAYFDFNENSGRDVVNRVTNSLPKNDLSIVGTLDRTDVAEFSTSGPYSIAKFPRSYITANNGWKVPTGISNLRYLVVAGGGAGGGSTSTAFQGGGGGGGGVRTGVLTSPSGVITPVVGAGQVVVSCVQGRGGNSRFSGTSFSAVEATGGGSGGCYNGSSLVAGNSGGSGGGGASQTSTSSPGNGNAGSYSPVEGFIGGTARADGSSEDRQGGGGGGGATSAGTAATYVSGTFGVTGNGGTGFVTDISGNSLGYGGGGGGGARRNTAGGTATDGGGTGGKQSTQGSPGVYGRGGGGGGSSTTIGNNGGSGVIIIRWITATAPIFTGPASDTLTAGMVETFTVGGTPNAPLTRNYRWQVSSDTGTSWVNATTGTGFTSANYVTPILETSTSGTRYRYRVVVTDSDTAGLSIVDTSTAIVFLTINPRITITGSSVSLTQKYGQTQSVTYTIANGTGTRTTVASPNNRTGITWSSVSGSAATLGIGAGLSVGTYYETLTVTDSVTATTTQMFTIAISKADTITVTMDTITALTFTGSAALTNPSVTISGLSSADTATVQYNYEGSTLSYSATSSGLFCASGGSCAIGDLAPGGGRVFYVSATKINAVTGISDGGIYLATAPNDWATLNGDSSYYHQFGCNGTLISGTYTDAIGTGALNTKQLAALSCGVTNGGLTVSNASINGFTDWFIPTIEELKVMRTNLYVPGLATRITSNAVLWSSIPVPNSLYESYYLNTSGTSVASSRGNSRNQGLYITPIRAFSPLPTSSSVAPTDAGNYTVLPVNFSIASPSSLANYQGVTVTGRSFTINKANQARLTIGQYDAFPGISTYPLNVYGGTGLGAVTRSLVTTGTANCTLTNSMFLSATNQGTCGVRAVKSGGINYLDETTTATIYWIQFVTNYANGAAGGSTGITLTGETAIEKRTYETFTVLSFANGSGTAITSAGVNSILRIIGTGFNAADSTTEVFFGMTSVPAASLTFNVVDPLANYVQLTVPADAETDRVVMRSAKGWATSPGTLTITP